MSAPRYARLVSKLLVDAGEPAAPPPSVEARARAIDALGAALDSRGRSRRLMRWGGAVAAAAALVVVAGGTARIALRRSVPVAATLESSDAHHTQIVARAVDEGASVVVSGAQAPLTVGRAITEGSRLVTPPNGRATLAFATGTTVTLGEDTNLNVNGDVAMQVLRLATGWVDLHVAKVGASQRFVVATADSEVEVRGTQFRVSLARPDAACGGGTPTRVAVTEGVVVVRHDGVESRVGAGEMWPAGCSVVANANASRAAGSGAGSGVSPRSTLAEQNDLYNQGLTAEQRGDARGALAAYDRFLAKYPSSVLAEGATVKRMRVLRTLAPARAIVAARQYLAAYPDGAAHDEAEAIVSGTP